jgi:hypothetical protein
LAPGKPAPGNCVPGTAAFCNFPIDLHICL